MEEIRRSDEVVPALSARITPQDSRFAGRLFPTCEPEAAMSSMLGNKGHELRTAAAAILALGELFEAGEFGPVTGAQRDAIQRVKACGETVLRHVNDLLIYERCEQHSLQLQRRPVAAGELIQRAMRHLQPALDAKHHRLEIAMDLPLPTVEADPDLMTQALCNLLDNACRYTPTGGHLAVRAHRDATMATWEVSDDGPGLRVDEALFDPATQVPLHARARSGGSGLGLGTARRIAELHGGCLELSSVPGHGCTARLKIPTTCEA